MTTIVWLFIKRTVPLSDATTKNLLSLLRNGSMDTISPPQPCNSHRKAIFDKQKKNFHTYSEHHINNMRKTTDLGMRKRTEQNVIQIADRIELCFEWHERLWCRSEKQNTCRSRSKCKSKLAGGIEIVHTSVFMEVILVNRYMYSTCIPIDNQAQA